MYDKASLALIPSGYKDSELYSVLPANGDGDFEHIRTSTATRVNKDGLIESVAIDTPRLDYTGNCPHLLLEPQRRNLFADSDLSGLSPTTSGDGAATNTVLSNGLTGKKISITSSGRVFYSITTTCVIGTQYTVSCYVDEFVGATESNFIDITTGGNNEDFSTSLLTNGRMQGTFTATATSVQIRIGIGTTSNRTGTKSAKISGVQLEDGSSGVDATFATSLIQTTGIIKTRSADICNNAGTSAEFNVTEGVLFAEIKGLVDVDASNRYISLTDGTVANSVMIQYRNSGELRLYNGGTSSSNMIFRDASADLTQNKKIAIKYGSSTSNYKVFINGVEKTVDSGFSASALTALDEIKFTYVTSGNGWYGNVKQLIYFNEALSDSELQTLTS
jgi:hypothetical protein